MVRLVIMVAAISAVMAGAAERAQACSCLPATIESSYNTSSDVIRARVLSKVVSGTTTRYITQVQRTFKGCLTANQRVVLRTATSSATCGVSLSVGSEYLINGDAAGSYLGMPQVSVVLCDYNRPFASLTPHDLTFLNGRTVCCGSRCTCADGSQPVNCFVDPCQVAPECPEGECVANYCGGCNAEFYDARGNAVCEACQSDKECASGEYCATDGACKTDGLCELEVDCSLPGNSYPHIACVGHGVCDRASGSCGFQCENPLCVDLAGYDFGPCDAVLGVVVVNGRCVEVSGCSADPFQVFGSVAECERACGLTKAECASDADCMVTGCSGQVCAPRPVITTCEWRPEYACYRDRAITSCGCEAGLCAWDRTPALEACLGGSSSVSR
jgi:eight-cysteine-cluster-containing protein